MSREIKFRAWDKKTKQIVDVKAIVSSSFQPDFDLDNRDNLGDPTMFEGVWIDRNGFEELREFNEVILEQYAGLCDKTRKHELYAGDRIAVGHDRGFIAWDEYELCWGIEVDDDVGFQAFCRFYTDEEMRNIEYLGNVHEEKP